MRKKSLILFAALFLLAAVLPLQAQNPPDPDRLSPEETQMVNDILEKMQPTVEKMKAAGTLPVMTYEDLYLPLRGDEEEFLEAMTGIGPEFLGVKTPFLGIQKENPQELVRLDRQPVKKPEGYVYLETQYLPSEVYKPYRQMMDAMTKDLGQSLMVASGYRSPAYQLYLFISFLPKHNYSIRQTAKWNAFPGYSEHGSPENQAIDFVNMYGVDGEENPELFEALREYKWLMNHAKEYHFYLSYPRGNPLGIEFEPWHWRYGKPPGSDEEPASR